MSEPAAARALYRAFLRQSNHFGTSYNIKECVAHTRLRTSLAPLTSTIHTPAFQRPEIAGM